MKKQNISYDEMLEYSYLCRLEQMYNYKKNSIIQNRIKELEQKDMSEFKDLKLGGEIWYSL